MPWQYTSRASRFDCGPVWGTVRLRYVYERVEYGVGTVLRVSALRETRHLGYKVVGHSGRHGYPAVGRERGRGVWYDAAEVEFAMGTGPDWVFTHEVGHNSDYPRIIGDVNTLTMPQSPDDLTIQGLDALGRGPISDDNGCDTETDSDTEDDEILSRSGQYPSGYPFQDIHDQ